MEKPEGVRGPVTEMVADTICEAVPKDHPGIYEAPVVSARDDGGARAPAREPVCPRSIDEQLRGRGWVSGYRMVPVTSVPQAAPVPEIKAMPRLVEFEFLPKALSGRRWNPTGAVIRNAGTPNQPPQPIPGLEISGGRRRIMPTPFDQVVSSVLLQTVRSTALPDITGPGLPMAGWVASGLGLVSTVAAVEALLREPFVTETLGQDVPPLATRPGSPGLEVRFWRTCAAPAVPELRSEGSRVRLSGASLPSAPGVSRHPAPVAGAAQPWTAAPSPVWEMRTVLPVAPLAIRPMWVPGTADRMPLRLSSVTGADAPIIELSLNVRLPARASLALAGMGGCKRGVSLSEGAQAVAGAGAPLEWEGAILPPPLPTLYPGARPVDGVRSLCRAPVISSPWCVAEAAMREPVESLAEGSGLSACEYRTRSML